MADFQDWLDAVGGGGDDPEVQLFDDRDEPTRNQRDAVLFCIDARSSSFRTMSGVPAPFESFVKHVIRFCQEKIITSDRDLVGVVLFGTQQQCNAHGFPNLYVFHELGLNSASRVQELELLATASQPEAPLFADFKSKIGHCDLSTTATAADRPKFAMSELLWSVLHMFNHLPAAKVAFRRAFVFTCDENPPGPNTVERSKCFARARDLVEHNISLEVFAHGTDMYGATGSVQVAGGSSPSGAVTLSGVPSSRPGSAARASMGDDVYGAVVVSGPSAAASPALTPVAGAAVAAQAAKGLPVFDRGVFWEPLVQSTVVVPATRESSMSVSRVHVGDLSDRASSASAPRLRSYPQRTMGSIQLIIGPDLASPSVLVSIFLPIAKCSKPKFMWLETSTNALVTSESRQLTRETGLPVAATDIQHTAKIGATDSVQFATDEVDHLKAQFGDPAIRVLGFRKLASMRTKWSVGRSSFLYINAEHRVDRSAVLFKELHRTMSQSSRYAEVEVIARRGAAPRLALLIAATTRNTNVAAIEFDDAQAMGFHLVPLPYADDYRSITLPDNSFTKPPAESLLQARRIVEKLSVSFDPESVANPALQKQYFTLQQMALMDDSSMPPVDTSLPDREGMASVASTLMKAFREATYGAAAATYCPEAVAPPPKAAKPPPSSADMATIDMDTLESTGQLGTLTIPYLKQFLKEHRESTSGLKQDLVDRVSRLVQRQREKRGRDD